MCVCCVCVYIDFICVHVCNLHIYSTCNHAYIMSYTKCTRMFLLYAVCVQMYIHVLYIFHIHVACILVHILCIYVHAYVYYCTFCT